MMDFSSIHKRQWYLLTGIGAFIFGGGLVYILLTASSPAKKPVRELKSQLTTGTSRVNPQEAWVYNFKSESDVTKKRLDSMEDMMAKLLKMNEAPKPSEAPDLKPASLNQVGSNGSDPISVLRSDLKENMNPIMDTPKSGETLPMPPVGRDGLFVEAPDQDERVILPHPGGFRSKSVKKITLSLKNARPNKPLKTVDNTIPAGSFVRAVLLGGVDASASIQASSDPRPALLRLVDMGTLPRQFHSDLKGCHALAACYGDISSERVMMRLEKLTCVERKTGEILEVKIQGYVAGEDGRTGVRGSVVDRAGESMRNAMIGGFVGGMGEFLAQSRNTVTFSPLAGLAQANPMGLGDMAKHGAGRGVSNALDKYADFYIKRAEQVQPVIQVAAGRHVDIVFTEGVSLDESLYREATSRANDQERYQQIQSATETPQRSVEDWTKGGK